MALYKLYRNPDIIIRTSDGASIPVTPIVVNPADPTKELYPVNSDYRAYLAWVDLGNTPDPADPAPLIYSSDKFLNARVTTTDATVTEMFRATLQQNTGYTAILTVIGVDTGNGNCRVIRASVAAKRLSGSAALIGAPVAIANHQDAGASAWAATGSVTGNDFLITVTGAAGRTIAWSLTGSFISFTPSGS